jgi:serine/threonine-protein kinase
MGVLVMGATSFLVDPYADTLELPVSGELEPISADCEHEQIVKHLASQFQVVREIGRGGMGIVFLARDIALHRLVAIKVLRHEFTSSEEHRERFRREARMTARLSHPNIVPVHTFGEVTAVGDDSAGPLVYIVMKYVHGESLAERMRRGKRLPAAEVQRILRDLALALDSAHRDGVVHRDLKAENILIERGSGRAMLTDFGVALLRSLDPVHTESARAFGTPHYMSPEQAAGELDIDGRSDLYSLGVLGYYMLSGELPFDGHTFESLAARHIGDKHVPLATLVPDAASGLCDAIERCLVKQRADRWRSGRELADALSAVSAKRRWFGRTRGMPIGLARTRVVAELAMVAAAMKAVFRWTMI